VNERRRWLIGGMVAVAAGLVGAWVGFRRSNTALASPGAADRLFASTMQDPDGKSVSLANLRGRVLVVNFWATWCAPCVEEMPDLQVIRREFSAKGVEMIGIGIDSPSEIRAFRKRLDIEYPLLVAGIDGTELAREFGNTAGALPFTVVLDRGGAIRYSKLGRIRGEELRSWVEVALS
jgi:peroxiredoxin